MTADLRDRIANAIARVTASKAADEVLAEIGKTHLLIERTTARATILDAIADWIDRDDWDDLTQDIVRSLGIEEHEG